MWAFLSSLLAAIPAAATSSMALAAFAITAAAYVITMWRVSRNKQLLANIQKLPPKDRLAALETEMGGVRLSSGISPEQWLRSRIHRFYFLAFAVTAVIATFLVGLLFVYREGSADISVDLKQSLDISRVPKMLSGWLLSPAYAQEDEASNDRTLKYSYSKDRGKLAIVPQLEYVDAQRRGDPVNGISYSYGNPFKWEFPSLAIKVANNTRQNLVLSEIVFRVRNSNVDMRPAFAVRKDTFSGYVQIDNDGWGGINNPAVKVSIKDEDKCNKFDLHDAQPVDPKAIRSDDRALSFSIIKFVPKELLDKQGCDNARCDTYPLQLRACLPVEDDPEKYLRENCSGGPPVCVQGQLDYDDQSGKHSILRFSTTVFLTAPPSAALPPSSYGYDVFLRAGKSNYTQRVSIAQEIKPGEADNFSLKIATDRSASFDFDMDILSVGGSTAWTGSFDMLLFVPRRGAREGKQSFDIVKAQ
jgi:hypothetical protein